MAQKKETVFRKKIVARLKTFKNTIIISVQQVALRGIPDLILCISGFFVALEIKSDERAMVAPLQRYTLDAIQKAKGIAFIVHPGNYEAILVTLEGLSQYEIGSKSN